MASGHSVVLFGGMEGAPVASMERYAESLLAELGPAGWPARLVRGKGLRITGRRSVEWAAGEFSSRVLYPMQARRVRASVYHVTDHSFGHLVNALPRERTVVTCHDLMPWLVPEIFSRRLGRTVGLPLWERSVRAMRGAAHVICVSECTRRDVIERIGVPEDRTSVIPEGVSEVFRALPNEQRAEARRSFDLPEDICAVLHVGHGQPYKNVEQVIRVVVRLRETGLGAEFVKVGRLTPEQEALAAEFRIPVRRLTGLSDERLNDLYNAADVLLFPSKYEGYGLPATEAMRAGLPVVISTAPALREVTANLAPAFAIDDTDGFTEAIRAVWDNRDRRAQNTQAARKAAEVFTWRRTACLTADVYARLCASVVP